MELNINIFKNIAEELKTDLETNLSGVWNIIVGTDFGSYISYDKGHLIFFNIKEINFLIFRFGITEVSNEKS